MLGCREEVAKTGLPLKPGRSLSDAGNGLPIGLVQNQVEHLGTRGTISRTTERDRVTA